MLRTMSFEDAQRDFIHETVFDTLQRASYIRIPLRRIHLNLESLRRQLCHLMSLS